MLHNPDAGLTPLHPGHSIRIAMPDFAMQVAKNGQRAALLPPIAATPNIRRGFAIARCVSPYFINTSEWYS
jgi:hypothetical protein